MGFIEKIEKLYITQFIPEFFEMKYVRKLKLPLLPIQNVPDEKNAVIEIENWFKSNVVQNKFKKLQIKQNPSSKNVVRKSTAELFDIMLK